MSIYIHRAAIDALLSKRPPERAPADDEGRMLTAAKKLGVNVSWGRGAGRAGPRGEWVASLPGWRVVKGSKGEMADALELAVWARGGGELRAPGALGGVR